MHADDLFDEILARLWQVRAEVSEAVFRDAAGAALVAIGRVVLKEAERRAAARRENVIAFPLTRAIRALSDGEERS